MKCKHCGNSNINNFGVVPKRNKEQRTVLLVACFKCGGWVLQAGKYDMGAFPVNYVQPAVALSVNDLNIARNSEHGYPISGDNIARVRAGVR